MYKKASWGFAILPLIVVLALVVLGGGAYIVSTGKVDTKVDTNAQDLELGEDLDGEAAVDSKNNMAESSPTPPSTEASQESDHLTDVEEDVVGAGVTAPAAPKIVESNTAVEATIDAPVTLHPPALDITELDVQELVQQLAPALLPPPVTQSSSFTCESNDGNVASRAYVLLLGINNTNTELPYRWLNEAVAGDAKNVGTLVFGYKKYDPLAQISQEFLDRFHAFVAEKKPQEVVIFGWSAGGTIAAASASRLNFDGKGEIHTVASPLKGYSLAGFLEFMLEGKYGLEREIGLGFSPWAPAPSNFTVHHHKTVNDSDLSGRCGDFASLCDPKVIQNNNLSGAREYYYPQYDHEPIMHAVTEMVIACRK